MTDSREITLGGRELSVPRLPHRLNRRAYPLCRDLIAGGLIDRCARPDTVLEVTDTEMTALADVAFLAAQAADPEMTQEAFEDMPITPLELLEAFFEIMVQTGGWSAPQATAA